MLFWIGIVPALGWQLLLATGYLIITPDQYSQLAYGLAKLLLVLWPLIWWRSLQRSSCQLIPNRIASVWGGLVLSVTILVVVGSAAWFLQDTLMTMKSALQLQVTSFGLTKSSYIWFALGLASIHAAFEEWYWRGFVFRGLRLKLSWPWAALVGSLAFSAHHALVLSQFAPWWLTVIGTVSVAVTGFVWCYLYQRTNSLFGNWLSHFLADIAVMSVGYWLIF